MNRLPHLLGIVVLVMAMPAWAQSPYANNGSYMNNGQLPATVQIPSAAAPTPATPKPLDVHFAADHKAAPTSTASPAPVATPEASPTQATQEAWYHQQYPQQSRTPADLVYQRAAANAEQRAQRLAAMKWFGYSNSRPRTGADVTNGDQAPGWVSNNATAPYHFTGYSNTQVVITQ